MNVPLPSYTTLDKNTDIKELEQLLIKDEKIITVPHADLAKFTFPQIQMFCLVHGLYQLPTTELIEFIQSEIGDTSAIEIGAGNGCIGRSLGIPMTDSMLQTRPEVIAEYESMGQPVIKYGNDVENLDGVAAVEKYRPQTVVACWVTNLMEEGVDIGNPHGVKEERILEIAQKYIHVGNLNIHAHKPILKKYPVTALHFPWIISRASQPQKNVIFIFKP